MKAIYGNTLFKDIPKRFMFDNFFKYYIMQNPNIQPIAIEDEIEPLGIIPDMVMIIQPICNESIVIEI